jgi:hypothetical protein
LQRRRAGATPPSRCRCTPEFAESLRAARTNGIIGAEVFTGKTVMGRVLPMNKKAWAMKEKGQERLAGTEW